MKTFLCLLCVYFSSLSGAADEFVIRYQALTSGGIFLVETARGARVGTVIREVQEGTVLYSYLDIGHQLLASAKTEKHEANRVVYLVDQQGVEMGSFSSLIYNLYPTEYKVFAPGQKSIAKGVMNWLGNSFALIDPEVPKRYLVTFLRPRFKLFNDYWHFQIHEEGAIDFRLLCIMGTFQTACDLIFDEL